MKTMIYLLLLKEFFNNQQDCMMVRGQPLGATSITRTGVPTAGTAEAAMSSKIQKYTQCT